MDARSRRAGDWSAGWLWRKVNEGKVEGVVQAKPVLVVEDNPDDEALALEAFRRKGVVNPVVVVRDGKAALDWLLAVLEDESRQLPALVLLDINLPLLDGIEVLRRINSHPQLATLPVVVLSTSSEARDLRDCYGAGASGYVCKPVEFAAFQDAVGKIADFWLDLNIPPPPTY